MRRVPSCGFERRNNGIDGINGTDYLTDNVYNELGEVLNNIMNDIQWQQDPAALRKVLPALFRMHLDQEDERKAEKKARGAGA